MIVKTYSYRFAEEILSNKKFGDIYNQIMIACKECPLAYDSRKSANDEFYYVQQVMNKYFQLRFLAAGWKDEPNASDDTNKDKLRADFRKEIKFSNNNIVCQIEVEFGNSASLYRDYYKFMNSYSQGLTDVAILIVPSHGIAKHITSGVSYYEKVLRELPTSKLSITVPILVIGLFDEDETGRKVSRWDLLQGNYTLNAVKGSSLGPGKRGKGKFSKAGHEKMVQDYIDKICKK